MPDQLPSPIGPDRDATAVRTETDGLLVDLRSDDGMRRKRARAALVELGRPVVARLLELVDGVNDRERAEAAMALGEIGDPHSATRLVEALEDRDFGIRWSAAAGLAHIGRPALPPLLSALTRKQDSEWLREGAHHVLKDMRVQGLSAEVQEVLAALEGSGPNTEVLTAAVAALRSIRAEAPSA